MVAGARLNMAQRAEVVVLGAGISGLTTAWAIVRASAMRLWRGSDAPCPKITIIDSGKEVGGCIQTHYGPGGLVLEQGPRGLRPSGIAGRATLNLAASVGLTDSVIVAGREHPGAANRFVYSDGQLNKLPSGAFELVKNIFKRDPITLAMAKGILTEAFSRGPPANTDETVYNFAARRLGHEVAARLLDPLTVGIFGGDCRNLSVASAFPLLVEFEKLEGSLVLGAIRQDANTPPLPMPEPGTEDLLGQVDGARIWSLSRGMTDLPNAVKQWLLGTGMVDIRLRTQCTSLERMQDGRVMTQLHNGKSIVADHVISALPAQTLSRLLHEADSQTANTCASIPTNGIAVANYVFRGKKLGVDGFGYLVPTTESEGGVLGVVFDSCAFPQQDDAVVLGNEVGAITRLTVMTGGPKHHELYDSTTDVSDAAVHDASARALHEHLGISADPIYSAAKMWTGCMPQYTPGHAVRVQEIRDSLAKEWDSRLSVTGNSFQGVGVNDCVLSATRLGTTLVNDGFV